jgi:SAM-dependent methyltransferase
MKVQAVPGTKGYAERAHKFIQATIAIDFLDLHHDFLPFIPKQPSRVLDLGAGIGRDAFELAKRGHEVIAMEPIDEFRMAGQTLYPSPQLEWLDDCLPMLSLLGHHVNQFDFILASGVWHHLKAEEQALAMRRITHLLKVNGVFAVSLRNGPAGAGNHIFPTSSQQTKQDAQDCGLTTLLCLEGQPSLMPNKENVFWTRLVFERQEHSKNKLSVTFS